MLKRDALTGNEAIAHGVRLSKVKVIAAYPITPQTTIVETLAKFIAEGSLPAQYVESEGEHGAVGTVIGAAMTGVRSFTATCSQGFAYGFENIAWVPGVRLPIVMAVPNRSLSMPLDIGCDHTDAMCARDLGWIQLYVQSNQEALDTIIQAYRIAEDKRILLPVMVCLDGFYITHATEMVEMPDEAGVDRFLPVYVPEHIVLDPNNPLTIPETSYQGAGMAYDYLKNEALMRAKGVIAEVNDEFGRSFGRRYGNGLVEKVHCDDAEVVLVTMGSMSGNGKVAIEELRNEGKRVGLVRLRSFRPFPKEDFLELGRNVKVIGVVDRNVSRGLGEGACVTEVKSTLYNLKGPRASVLGFTAGLHGTEVLISDIKYMANKALEVARTGNIADEQEWIPNMDISAKIPSPVQREQLLFPGVTACPGCGMVLAFREVINSIGKNVVVIRNAGCGAWQAIPGDKSGVGVPLGRSTLPAGSACATGVSLGLKEKGQDEVEVVLFGGDGSVGDMGFMGLSGAAERNSDFICVVYDNEAYANTGIQRSGTTPLFAWTTTTPVGITKKGKGSSKKDLPLIVAAHRVPYVATASIAYLDDLRRKLDKAKAMQGFRYIHIYAPCPPSWRCAPEKMIKVARLGVTTGVHNLYEIEGGKLQMTVKPEKVAPVSEYLKLQGRFAHLIDADVDLVQEKVDRAREHLLRWEESGLSLPVAPG